MKSKDQKKLEALYEQTLADAYAEHDDRAKYDVNGNTVYLSMKKMQEADDTWYDQIEIQDKEGNVLFDLDNKESQQKAGLGPIAPSGPTREQIQKALAYLGKVM